MADPECTEANQAYLQMKLGTFTGIAGRQRVILDNARFIGNVGWRQNEQTYDAVTFKSAALPKTQLHVPALPMSTALPVLTKARSPRTITGLFMR